MAKVDAGVRELDVDMDDGVEGDDDDVPETGLGTARRPADGGAGRVACRARGSSSPVTSSSASSSTVIKSSSVISDSEDRAPL